VVTAELALSVAFRASCAALAIGFIEQRVVFRRAFGPTGPFSPSVADVFGRPGWQRRLLDPRFQYVLVAGAAAAATGVAAGPFSVLGRVATAVLVLCTAMTKWRRPVSSDGAEQMAVLTVLATGLTMVPGMGPGAVSLAVYFIGGQLILSYLTSGVAKAVSQTWRNGAALPLIMGSEAYGHPSLSSLLQTHFFLSKALTWFVILFECVFVVVLCGPREVTVALLAVGLGFHVACAVTMGLNAFLMAFPGSYLCVAYVAQRMSVLW